MGGTRRVGRRRRTATFFEEEDDEQLYFSGIHSSLLFVELYYKKHNKKHFDPLLDNVDMATLMGEDVDSESDSQNGLRGVGVEDPSHEKKRTMATGERPGIPGESHSSRCSSHERTIFITTDYGVDLLRKRIEILNMR